MKIKNRNIITFLLATGLIISACKTNQVMVKFKNESAEDFKRLHVNIMGKEFHFTDLKSGNTTQYISVPKVYPYCWAQAITEKDTLGFIPIDYVGEKLYTSGKLLMKLKIEGQDNMRRLEISSKR